MSYTLSIQQIPIRSNIVVVGCGGTGSMVSEGLCRLLVNQPDRRLLLIDHDRVEPHNLRRQNFYQGDVGKFKSQALAERLSRFYGREIAYSILPYSRRLLGEASGYGMSSRAVESLIIGCVDNSAARLSIAESLDPGTWWLDSGNGRHSGQVLIGNARKPEELRGGFRQSDNTVNRLPLPSLQLPSLLAPTPLPARPVGDCARAVEADEQSPVINQAMAVLVLEFVSRLLNGHLTWMGVYLDLDAGTLRTVPAEPETVARMCGVRVDTLMADESPGGGKTYR